VSASENPEIAEPPIYVTRHAREQADVRFRSFYRERGVDGIYAEVVAALAAGRRAKTVPRWAVIATRRSKIRKRGGTGVAVWNAEETRCYVLIWGQTWRGPGWVVVTVLGREDREAAA
jgi:hypothetical protein